MVTRVWSFKTRREYVHVGSGAASLRHTVFHNQTRVTTQVWKTALCNSRHTGRGSLSQPDPGNHSSLEDRTVQQSSYRGRDSLSQPDPGNHSSPEDRTVQQSSYRGRDSLSQPDPGNHSRLEDCTVQNVVIPGPRMRSPESSQFMCFSCPHLNLRCYLV